MKIELGKTWQGANWFSKALFVLTILGVPTTIYATISNIISKPSVDYTKLSWRTTRDIDTIIPKGTIVSVLESDGVNFKIKYLDFVCDVTINELELV